MLVQSRDLKNCPNELTYECNLDAMDVSLGITQSVMSCALNARFPNGSPGHYKEGNYIIYDIENDGSHDRLEIQEMVEDCCRPKPQACHCNTLLRKVLLENLKEKPRQPINRIDGQIPAKNFMEHCKCYLGVAADFMFRWVDDCDDVASKRIEFTRNNYVQVCEKLKKQKCEGNARLYRI